MTNVIWFSRRRPANKRATCGSWYPHATERIVEVQACSIGARRDTTELAAGPYCAYGTYCVRPARRSMAGTADYRGSVVRTARGAPVRGTNWWGT